MADEEISITTSEKYQQQIKNKKQDNEIISNSTNTNPILTDVDPNYIDLIEQCESLRRSNLQLREEILIIDNENNDLKKKTKKESKENSKQRRSNSRNKDENFKKPITRSQHHKENNLASSSSGGGGGVPDPKSKSKSKIPVMASDSKKKTTPNKQIKDIVVNTEASKEEEQVKAEHKISKKDQVKIQVTNYDDEKKKKQNASKIQNLKKEEYVMAENHNDNNNITSNNQHTNADKDDDNNSLDSGPTSLHLSSIICSEHHTSNTNSQPINNGHFNSPCLSPNSKKLVPIEVVEKLRSELMDLKEWKAKATQEIVDRDRALADLENELIKQQSEFDISNEECVGHQKTIQELKSALDQMSNGERTVESPFSERPKSSHYWHHPNSIPDPLLLHSPNSHTSTTNVNQTLTGSDSNTTRPGEVKFHSSFARCLNMPPLTLDQVSWLENELLETRQRLIQTEADLMRLEEVHSALLIEHKNLQGDYGTLHGYVEVLEDKLENEMDLNNKAREPDEDFKKEYWTIIEDLDENLNTVEKMKLKVEEMKQKQKQKNLEGFGSVIIDEDPQDVNQLDPPVDYMCHSLLDNVPTNDVDTVWKIDLPITDKRRESM